MEGLSPFLYAPPSGAALPSLPNCLDGFLAALAGATQKISARGLICSQGPHLPQGAGLEGTRPTPVASLQTPLAEPVTVSETALISGHPIMGKWTGLQFVQSFHHHRISCSRRPIFISFTHCKHCRPMLFLSTMRVRPGNCTWIAPSTSRCPVEAASVVSPRVDGHRRC